MLRLLPRNLSIDFISKWKIAALFSILLVVGSIYQWITLGESKYGIDFTGGHDILVRVSSNVTGEQIRSGMQESGFDDVIVQSFEAGTGDYSIRLQGRADPESAKEIKSQIQAIISRVSSEKSEILKTDFVGPTVGVELRRKAMIATCVGIIGLLIYITFRFEFAFALGAVVAVFHDVIIAGGVYLFAGHTINMSTVAAALTILGYSVNDTIVIFDRVREELRNPRYRELDLQALINLCINQTMSRTIITSMLTLFSVAAILFLGGGSTKDLSLFLFAGMISGIYSTVYIAAPVVLGWEAWRRRGITPETAKA